MGQAKADSLSYLLLLGEPEAVVAAVHAEGLTDELAARAWWAMPTSENARRMLEKQAVVEGETGKILAEFLLEFLPFEEEQNDIIESVRLVLQPGLISQQEKEKLWSKTKTKRSFYVGFLHAAPDDLPVEVAAHVDYEKVKQQLKPLLEEGNPYALMLEKVLSAKGQAFINTIEDALKKPGNQDVVVSLLDAVSKYFESIIPETFTEDELLNWRYYWLAPYSPFRRSFWKDHPYINEEYPNIPLVFSFAREHVRFARTDIPCVRYIRRNSSHSEKRINEEQMVRDMLDRYANVDDITLMKWRLKALKKALGV